MYRTLNLSYTQWKSILATFELTLYYLENDNRYDPFLVDVDRQFVYRTQIMKIDSSNTDLIDFESNFKSGGTVKFSIDDGVTAAVAATFE